MTDAPKTDIATLLASIPSALLVDEMDRRIIAAIPETDDYRLTISTREVADKLGIDVEFVRRVAKRLRASGQIIDVMKRHPYSHTVCGWGYVRKPRQ
jgi:CRP-like cAMP-binding protein